MAQYHWYEKTSNNGCEARPIASDTKFISDGKHRTDQTMGNFSTYEPGTLTAPGV
jgi:hypothetical protein